MSAAQRTYRPFGAELTVSAEPPCLLAAFEPAVARIPRDAGCEGRFHVSVTTIGDGDDDPAWPVTAVNDDARSLTLRCGTGELRVDHHTGRAAITLPESLAAIDDAVRCFAEGAVSSLLIGSGRLHAVHSALVVRRARGVLLRGVSGAGKSTLTYACMRRGWQITSDDWVYGVSGAPADTLHGYPWRMFLTTDTVRFFPELAAASSVPHPGSDRVKVPIEPPRHLRRRTSAVHAVVFVGPEPRAGWAPVPADQAVAMFWNSALPSERRDLPPSWVAGLLARPCFVLHRGVHPDAAADALQDLTLSLE